MKVDVGPQGGSRSHYRWSLDADWGAKKLGNCPGSAKIKISLVRIGQAYIRGIVETKGERYGYEMNNVARCDVIITPWDIRAKWEKYPTNFTKL